MPKRSDLERLLIALNSNLNEPDIDDAVNEILRLQDIETRLCNRMNALRGGDLTFPLMSYGAFLAELTIIWGDK